MHTHTHREHTPGAVNSHFCCGTLGEVGGLVLAQGSHLSHGIEGRESTAYPAQFSLTLRLCSGHFEFSKVNFRSPKNVPLCYLIGLRFTDSVNTGHKYFKIIIFIEHFFMLFNLVTLVAFPDKNDQPTKKLLLNLLL